MSTWPGRFKPVGEIKRSRKTHARSNILNKQHFYYVMLPKFSSLKAHLNTNRPIYASYIIQPLNIMFILFMGRQIKWVGLNSTFLFIS